MQIHKYFEPIVYPIAQCSAQRCIFLSGEFTTMAVINPLEKKLAKRTSVQCSWNFFLPFIHSLNFAQRKYSNYPRSFFLFCMKAAYLVCMYLHIFFKVNWPRNIFAFEFFVHLNDIFFLSRLILGIENEKFRLFSDMKSMSQ